MTKRQTLDLDPRSREALDFDELLRWVAQFCRTSPGEARVLALAPTADGDELTGLLASVHETARYVDREGALLPGGLPDPTEGLRGLGIEGRRLEPLELRGLASVLRAVGELAAAVGRTHAEDYPILRQLARTLPDLRHQASEILRAIAPDGSLEDEASAELRRVRRHRQRAGERLKARLESYLQRPDAGTVLRDDFITQRNGRFVIPVRTDTPHPVQGIVHASSSSGATNFVEPIETVELNNELVRLAEQEQQEVDRILTEWTDRLRARAGEVDAAVEGLAELDALQARVLFGRETEGRWAQVEADGPVRLEGMRHPLLERRLFEAGRSCVAMDLALDPFDRVLVLSGPNAGGKTVALKTLGLAVLMAQSGIPVPARTVRLPVYRQVRADIGDHQSMQADLSTFSAHVTAVAKFLAEAASPALLLFDEIGSGTDPVEGGALAQAILEAASRDRMTTVATTHHSALKSWAFTSPRAESAALEFDKEKLRPTYRVIMGSAGVSAGLEIAGRVGLQSRIVERARELLGGEERRAEEYLDRLHRMAREMEARQASAEAGRQEREAELAKRRQALEEDFQRQKRESAEQLERLLADFGRKADVQLREIRGRRAREKAEARVSGLRNEARRRHRETLDPVDPALEGSLPDRLEPGMQVYVRSLGRSGVVLRVDGASVQVRLGRVPFTVDRGELRVGSPGPPAEEPARRETPSRGPRPASDLEPAAPTELMLIGMRVEEGLEELDRFLDESAVAGLSEVRVVHGHGTGRLRKAVRDFLTRHAHVRSHRPGKSSEGGDGATVATLR
jgi:DNA mismatch repair protein MutS2